MIEKSVNYKRGTGFGTITLECDGVAALSLLHSKLIADPKAAPQIEGRVVLQVRDKSDGGRTSEFETSFLLTWSDSLNQASGNES